jgi:hypothetical protein
VIHHIKHDTWQSINPQGQMCDVHSHQGIYLQAGWTGTSKGWLETAFFYFPKFRVGNIQGKGNLLVETCCEMGQNTDGRQRRVAMQSQKLLSRHDPWLQGKVVCQTDDVNPI